MIVRAKISVHAEEMNFYLTIPSLQFGRTFLQEQRTSCDLQFADHSL